MPPIAPGLRTPQRRALLIGICYRDTNKDEWPILYGTHQDVEKFRALLRGRYAYAEDEITVMKDDEGVPSRLWPTAQNIRRELDRLVRGTAPGDQLVLLFCGHSDQLDPQETRDKTEEDGQDEVIIACDAKRIVDNELKYRLVTSLRAGVNLTAIFDSCHSGTLLDLPHHHCNQVYVPWLSTTRRRTRTMQYQITRRFARIAQPFALPDPSPDPAPLTTRHNASAPLPPAPPRPARTPLSVVRLSLDTRVRAPKPKPKPRHARFFSPAREAAAPFDSPVTYDSPVGLYACDGWCEPWDGCGGAAGAVVSLSSCSDLQQSWESDRVGSMTTMLCKYLEKHETGAPSYHEVMSHINFELHAVARQLHAWTRQQRKEHGHDAPGELRSFQTPELSSLVKLDMDKPFRLGLQDDASPSA